MACLCDSASLKRSLYPCSSGDSKTMLPGSTKGASGEMKGVVTLDFPRLLEQVVAVVHRLHYRSVVLVRQPDHEEEVDAPAPIFYQTLDEGLHTFVRIGPAEGVPDLLVVRFRR